MSPLRALAVRYRLPGAPPLRSEPPMDHDAGEAEAMRDHYAAPAGPDLPERDPLAEGLLRGFWAHRGGQPA